MNVHPVAALFPMMGDDELRELADDIAERGLLQPIVLDDQDRVLDGRNRLAACELAGVEPRFETYKGDDPDGYALATNVQRRSLTETQRAQVIVDAIPDELFSLNTRGLGTQLAAEHAAKQPAIAKAIAIRRHLGERDRKAVREGASGTAAYTKAIAVRDIEAEAPDLAAQLAEGDLSLSQAQAELSRRRQEQREADSRSVDRLRGLIRGWIEIPVRDDQSGRRDRILQQLTPDERSTVLDVEAYVNGHGHE